MKKRLQFFAAIMLMLFSGCSKKAPSVSCNENDLTFRTDSLQYTIRLNDCVVTEFIDRSSGKNYVRTDKPQYFSYLTDLSGNTLLPSGCRYADGVLTLSFDGTDIRIRPTVRSGYIIFEVLSELPDCFDSLYFAMSELSLKYPDDGFSAFGYIMNMNTESPYYPAQCSEIYARCTSEFGSLGARVGVIGTRSEDFRDTMKAVNSDIPEGDMPVSAAGGPFALDVEKCRGSYVILSDIKPNRVAKTAEFYSGFGINQLDFHQGQIFRQGDFAFQSHYYPNGASDFKEKISDPLAKNGIVSGLHTYAMFIDVKAAFLSEPDVQRDLDVIGEYTLASALSETDTGISLAEGVASFSDQYGFFVKNSPYFLIDGEIVKFTLSNGAMRLSRGECGTEPSAHSAGSRVAHLTNYFNMFAPVPGSELYYRVARATAQAYNDGGFGMIYFDALDGLYSAALCPGKEWHYAAAFINEILKYCETPPLIEYSAMAPSLWYARSRIGAYDMPTAGYREFIRTHAEANRLWLDNFLPTQLGWFSLWPESAFGGDPLQIKPLFPEDVDYLGCKCLAYGSGMSHLGLNDSALRSYPGLKRNAALFDAYEKLRLSNAFSAGTLEALGDLDADFSLVETDGGYAFLPAAYQKEKLLLPGAAEFENPFSVQTPFIRIENYFSADTSSNAVLLHSFDQSIPLSEQPLSVEISPPADISSLKALEIRISGDNSGGAICVRLASPTYITGGVNDYIIKIDFSGERDIILAETDNGEFPELTFEGKPDGLYAVYREQISRENVTSIQIFTCGDCSGVRIGDVSAVAAEETLMVSPSVALGSGCVTFDCTVKSGEWLEFRSGKAVLYSRRGLETEVSYTGSVEAPGGAFSAQLSAENTDLPLRGRLTFGFFGDSIR